MAVGGIYWGKAIVDNSGMARAMAIKTIFEKGVFRGTVSKKWKSGAEIGPTKSAKEPDPVATTKSKAEGLERAGEWLHTFIALFFITYPHLSCNKSAEFRVLNVYFAEDNHGEKEDKIK